MSSTSVAPLGTGESWVELVLTRSGNYSLQLRITDAHTSDGDALGASPYDIAVFADESRLPSDFEASVASMDIQAGERSQVWQMQTKCQR